MVSKYTEFLWGGERFLDYFRRETDAATGVITWFRADRRHINTVIAWQESDSEDDELYQLIRWIRCEEPKVMTDEMRRSLQELDRKRRGK